MEVADPITHNRSERDCLVLVATKGLHGHRLVGLDSGNRSRDHPAQLSVLAHHDVHRLVPVVIWLLTLGLLHTFGLVDDLRCRLFLRLLLLWLLLTRLSRAGFNVLV